MDKTPAVSVIVPNYNHARFLPWRIDSVLQQIYQNFELILLDDCSTDDSRSVLSRYGGDPRVRVEYNEANSGSPFRQWAKGVRMSRGKYIWIAESDDYADKHLLERLVAVLERDEEIAFAYCRSWRVDENGNRTTFVDVDAPHDDPERWGADYVADGREECLKYFTYHNIVSNASSAVFRRAAWDAAGGVDETMCTSGDWKLWAALAMTGKVAYLSEPLNYYRKHQQTVRSRANGARVINEELQAVRWILGQVKPTRAVLIKAGSVAAGGWVPVIMSSHVPLQAKMSVLKSVLAIDPRPIRHGVGPAFSAVGRKFQRHWRDLRSFAGRQETSKAQ